jgi:hypothetical protein
MKKAAPIFLTLVLLAVTQLAAEARGHHYGWNKHCRNIGWGGGCGNNWGGWNRGGWGNGWGNGWNSAYNGWRNPYYGNNWGNRWAAYRHRGWW